MTEVALLPTAEADLDFVLAAERHPDNVPFIEQWTHEQHLSTIEDPNAAHFVVVSSGRRAGFVIVLGLRSQDRNLLLQRLIITDKGQGYGRAVLTEIVRRAFEEWGAHRLGLDVVDHNPRARHLYRSAGFVEEGTLRECYYYPEEGVFHSSVIMSMLEREYTER